MSTRHKLISYSVGMALAAMAAGVVGAANWAAGLGDGAMAPAVALGCAAAGLWAWAAWWRTVRL